MLTFTATTLCTLYFMIKHTEGTCSTWFVDNPSRCSSPTYRKWCPISSQRICSGISPPTPSAKSSAQTKTQNTQAAIFFTSLPRRSEQTATTRPSKSSIVVTTAKTTRRGSQSQKSDCSKWFREKPSRCSTGPHRNWCPDGARKVCPGINKNGCLGSSCEKETTTSPRTTSVRTARPTVKTTKTVPTTARTTTTTTEKRIQRDLDKIFRDCVKDHGAPRECVAFAKYDGFDLEKMVCQNIDCVNYLGPFMYCASNGRNNYDSCCKPAGIKETCRTFCDGTKRLRLNTVFANVQSAIKHKVCLDKQDDIIKCHKARHSGSPETSVRDYEERLGQQMKTLLLSQCGTR